MTILTDEDIGELKRDYGFGISDLNWWEGTRAIEAAVIERIKSRGAVAYRLLMDDGYEYFDAPTGEACSGCEALYRIED